MSTKPTTTVDSICQRLGEWAPLGLAESWDNVGLLVGDTRREVSRIMTCLTLSEDVADEAIEEQVELIITHHPLPFRPLSRITTETPEGRVLWKLIGNQIAIYSAHTAFDSALAGVNQQWAERLKLDAIVPLVACEAEPTTGTGRAGLVVNGTTLAKFAEQVCDVIDFPRVRVVGEDSQQVTKVAIACGSGGSLLDAALDAGCDAMVTGEATFHTLLAARAQAVAIVLTGHYASERFAIESLAERLANEFPEISVWASRHETNPVRCLP
jgi:dinuclear metal center YbgI/SA1388 family protein